MQMYRIAETRNAKSLNEENSIIDVEIKHPDFGWIDYTLTPDDPDGSISNSELLSMIGSDYAAYVPPTSEEIITQQAAEVRGERDRQLTQIVDPMVSNNLRWAELTDEQKTAWTTYRQELLDITKQSGFPQNVTWPTIPTGASR